ncbi:MAG: aminotransferase class V-fold PLP-dependent enzyme, partial [Myxococcota bacterium]
ARAATGILQPVAEVAAAAAVHGVPLHCDVAPVAGRQPLDLIGLGVASATVAAPMIGGPRGAGALLRRSDLELEPLWWGGSQEEGVRPGTQATLLARGLAAAATSAREQLPRGAAIDELRNALQQQLLAIEGAGVVGADAPRLTGTLAVGFAGLPTARLVARLSAAGLMVGSGAASVIRISLGWDANASEVTQGVALVRSVVAELRLSAACAS